MTPEEIDILATLKKTSPDDYLWRKSSYYKMITDKYLGENSTDFDDTSDFIDQFVP